MGFSIKLIVKKFGSPNYLSVNYSLFITFEYHKSSTEIFVIPITLIQLEIFLSKPVNLIQIYSQHFNEFNLLKIKSYG